MSLINDENKEKVEIKEFDASEFKDEKTYSKKQKFLAEFIGTLMLVFIGSGVGVYTNGDIVPIVFANGFVVTSLIYAFGRISGAQFNPSVTIPMYLHSKLTFGELIYYTIAQTTGGFLGSLFVAFCNKGKFNRLSSTKIGDYLIYLDKNDKDGHYDLDTWCYISALYCEFILTFGLVTVVFASTIKENNFNNLTGLIIGATLIMLIFTGFHISGASLNPVRSLAPALLEAVFGGNSKAIEEIWIYIIGPISGGIVASYVSLIFI